MEDFNWNYVWTALAINFIIVWIVPRAIKKPTGIQVIDDVVLYLNSTKSFLLSSSIVIALVVYGSHYWVETQTATHGSPKSGSPDF